MSKQSRVGWLASGALGLGLMALLAVPVWSAGPGEDGAVPADTAVLEVEAPDGAIVSRDGVDKGQQRTFTLGPFRPGQYAEYDVRVRFRDGGVAERKVLLRGGWRVRLPFRDPRMGAVPELVVQTGHAEGITSVAFSSDGRYLLTGSRDTTAVLWEVDSGRKVRTFEGHTHPVYAVAFSPDGKHVLTGSWDKTAALWEADSGRKVRAFKGHTGFVNAVAFSPDGKHVLTGSGDTTAAIWETDSGRKVRTFEGHALVTAVAFSPDGKHVLTGSWDKTAALWDAASGRKVRTFEGHARFVTAVAFSPDGKHVLTGSEDKTATLWDAASGRKVRTFEGHAGFVNAVAFSLDGKRVLTGSWDNMAVFWETDTGRQLRVFEGHTGWVDAVTFSPDGKHVLTGSYDNTAALWDAASGRKVRTFQGHTSNVHAVACSPDGKHVLTGSEDKTAALWDAASGRKVRTFQGHTNWVYAVAFSSDRKHVLIGSYPKTTALWEIETGRKVRTFEGHTESVKAVAFSPDGKHVLTGSEDKTAALWDAASGRKVRTFEGHTKGVLAVAFSPDGKYVLTGSEDKTAALWDVDTGRKVRTFEGHTSYVHAVAFSADGKYVLTGSYDNTAALWDIDTGRKVRTFEGHTSYVHAVAFSPDGKHVLTGSWDKTVALWDAASGRKVRTFEGHTHLVKAVAFSADGKHVLTGSGDGTTRLWDIGTGDEPARLITLDGTQDWLVVTPEGLFDGSRGGREQVAFRIGSGLNVVPLDRFFRDFYYPGLLAEIWRGQRLLPGKPLQVQPAPLIKMLVNAASDDPARKDRVTIDVALTDQGGGIQGPWLYHNGAAVPFKSTVRQDGKTQHHRFTLPLVRGDNRIEVRAATADGVRESDPALLTVPFDGKLPDPELYVVAIGINRHAADSGIANLDFCVPDTKDIVRLFQDHAGKLFRRVHVTQLLDEKATKAGILQAVTDGARKAQPQDALVLYVAGHGIALGQRFYLIPHDFKLAAADKPAPAPDAKPAVVSLRGYKKTTEKREAAVRSRGLAIDELGEALAEVPALKRVLIFDTCHSGSAIALAGTGHNPFAFRGAMERFSRSQGVYSLSATAADELAAETKELGHSILTYALLAGMKGVAGGPLAEQPIAVGPKGAVDVLGWFGYAKGRVPALYEKYVGRTQHIEVSGDDQPTFPLFSPEAK